jgi:DNA-binding NarL/FixJ family response regulator
LGIRVLYQSDSGTNSMPSRQRILIADDHLLIAELCQRLLEPEFDVQGIFKDGRELIAAAQRLRPDLIIVDISMPLLNGLDAAEQIKRFLPTSRIVYLTMYPDPELAGEALLRGGSGYLLKTCASKEILAAVRSVLRGEMYLSEGLSKEIVNQHYWEHRVEDYPCKELTDRQREVLQLLAEGKAMKEAAEILHTSTRTIAFHKYRIMKTLGAKTGAELVRCAVRLHLIIA